MRDFVTVVSGVPRSGTSLMMQMLAAGGLPVLRDDARPPDAHNPRGYYELAAVKRTARDPSWVREAPGRAVKVVHALLPSLPAGPSYRVVLMQRRLDEVIASQRAMLPVAEVDVPAEARLAELFAAQLEAARRWAAGGPGRRLLEVEHAALLRDPAAGAAAVARFLDGGLDERAMAATVDPALHRQRATAARGAG